MIGHHFVIASFMKYIVFLKITISTIKRIFRQNTFLPTMTKSQKLLKTIKKYKRNFAICIFTFVPLLKRLWTPSLLT